MPLISFKNVRLFKGSVTASGRKPQTGKEGRPSAWRRLRDGPVPLILLSGIVLTVLLSSGPSKSLPALQEGQIAPADIVSPSDFTLEDNENTEQRRKNAAASVLPVYVFDPNVLSTGTDKVRRFFAFGRETLKTAPRDFVQIQKTAFDEFGVELGPLDFAALDKAGYGADLETALINLLEKYESKGVLFSKSLFNDRETERGFLLLRRGDTDTSVGVQDVPDIKDVKERIIADINTLEMTPRKKSLLISLSFGFLGPNVSLDRAETEARRANARTRIDPVFYTIKKGRVLIRKGDEATAETIKRIAAINENLGPARAWQANVAGTFLLFILLLTTLWFYLQSLHPFRTAMKYFFMTGLTLVIGLLFYKLGAGLAGASSQNTRFFLFQNADSFTFAFPFQFGTILFAFLTTNTVALIFAVLNSLLAGYLLGGDFFLMIFSLIGGLGAIYGIKYYRKTKRTAVLKAGLFVVAPLNLFVIHTFHLIRSHGGESALLAAQVIMSLAGGILSAALAFVLLPIYENVFRFLTQSKLLELTNSESPLFRQLALQAPGSYHHSLVVSSLAEKAAEDIKIDPLLVKAGALYHDIGKIKMPEYFIENKDKKFDVHKDLTPSMSTLVIVNHVKEGVELARKERLPSEIQAIIEQHHGNSLVRYFYLKAKEKYDPEMNKVGEETFRYPGPAPQSKEAGLVMLADSVEAASRSLRSHKEEHLKRVIRDIFDNYLQDGQLDDCNFSLKELRTIAASFLATLRTVYQPRVDYPGFDFEMKKKKKPETLPLPKNGNDGWTNGHDRDPESPKDQTD
jgi:putative nucleotidyltransferase with HDIG domain